MGIAVHFVIRIIASVDGKRALHMLLYADLFLDERPFRSVTTHQFDGDGNLSAAQYFAIEPAGVVQNQHVQAHHTAVHFELSAVWYSAGEFADTGKCHTRLNI